MDDRLAKELRDAIDRHADSPELRELWLRVLGLQLLAEDSQPTDAQVAHAPVEPTQTPASPESPRAPVNAEGSNKIDP